MKLNDFGSKTLKDVLTKTEGPFSKSENVMLALELMEKGQELASNQITKVHLTNIIKAICTHLEWTEELNEQGTITEAPEDPMEENKNIPLSVSNVKKESENICKFYRSGKCKHGSSGKTCKFNHPTTCKKFELYGNKENGCKVKNCEKLHLSLCKLFMKQYGNKCRYFHPKRLMQISQEKGNKTEKLFMHEERPSYANVVRKSLQPQIQPQIQPNSPFLGLTSPVRQELSGQVHQVQQPSQGQVNHTQQTFLDMQNKQKQMMELFISLNQQMNTLKSFM